jgi:hypothetical protein
MGVHGGNDEACNYLVSSTDANGSESSEVIGVFVESKEMVCCEVRCHFRRNVI